MFKNSKKCLSGSVHSGDKLSNLSTGVHLMQLQNVIYFRFHVVLESSQKWIQHTNTNTWKQIVHSAATIKLEKQ